MSWTLLPRMLKYIKYCQVLSSIVNLLLLHKEGSVWCGVVPVVVCGVAWCCAVRCDTLWCRVVWCGVFGLWWIPLLITVTGVTKLLMEINGNLGGFRGSCLAASPS